MQFYHYKWRREKTLIQKLNKQRRIKFLKNTKNGLKKTPQIEISVSVILR